MPYHADHHDPVALKFVKTFRRIGNVQFFPQRTLPRPLPRGELVIHDSHVLARGVIGVGEVPAGNQRRPDGLKKTGQDRPVVRQICILIFWRRAFFVVAVVPVRIIRIERQMRTRGRSLDAGNFEQLRLHCVHEFVAAGRGGEAQRVFGGETRIYAQQRGESSHQQAGAGEQHHADRHFGGDQRGARIAPRIARRNAAAGFHSAAQVDAASRNRRSESKHNHGDQRNQQRVGKNRPAQFDGAQAQQRFRTQRQQTLHRKRRDQHRGGPASEAEHQTFDQQLPHQSPAPRADDRADRSFADAVARARQQQVRHIHAGDQQHQRDAREQQQQRAAHILHPIGLHRENRQRHFLRREIRNSPAQARGHAVQFGLRLTDADAWSQQADGFQVSGAVDRGVRKTDRVVDVDAIG